MTTYARLDSEIKTATELNAHLGEQLRTKVLVLQDVLGNLFVQSLVPDSPAVSCATCPDAKAILVEIESLYTDLKELTVRCTQLLLKRADTGIVPVDRDALTAGIERLTANLQTIELGVESNRSAVKSLCGNEGEA